MTSDNRTLDWRTPTRHLRRFWQDRDGAVTIDWVALTAFTLMLGMAAAFYVSSSVPHVASTVGEHLENTTVMPD